MPGSIRPPRIAASLHPTFPGHAPLRSCLNALLIPFRLPYCSVIRERHRRDADVRRARVHRPGLSQNILAEVNGIRVRAGGSSQHVETSSGRDRVVPFVGVIDRCGRATDEGGGGIRACTWVCNRCEWSEIMTDTKYAELKQMLEVRQRELQRALEVKLRDVRANNGHDGQIVGALDAADASNSELLRDIAVTLTEMTAEALARIDEALARIVSGVYGLCEECNGEISQQRLVALPFAVRCRDCQELHEIGKPRLRQFSALRGTSLPLFDAGFRD